ncbi:DUF402 domain-containing protein [Catellatospora tritici]|uniref:DUF402 domain-containing protein n=1 Tax=Catellatospora tritici TaxID=2851566 RepID=UPI001C2D8D18|nr:DUF402 domain-containing protein [Catellatospora tritici]MBV1855453.1 DUF402 domain-containing protein [Catellatospora tritici]
MEVLAVGDEVLVRLVKQGREKISYPARVLSDDGVHLVVQAPFAGDGPRDFGFVSFDPGDIFTEHYWRDRWYSVKEVSGPDGRKGWYCDVTRPAEWDADRLVVEDLDLDLWVSADRALVLRLDEDEFVASGIEQRDPTAAARARQALEELVELSGDGFASLG